MFDQPVRSVMQRRKVLNLQLELASAVDDLANCIG
jgi:hypothetical protein